MPENIVTGKQPTQEQLRFFDFLAYQTRGYASPSEAKTQMRKYFERVLAGESGAVDASYRAYLEKKLGELERVPESFEALGQFAAKTGTMGEFLTGIQKSTGVMPTYRGWTEASGPMPSGVTGGVTEVAAGAKLYSPSERRIYYGTTKGTEIREIPVKPSFEKETSPTGIDWFNVKETSPLQKVLLSTGEVPSWALFEKSRKPTLAEYQKKVKQYEKDVKQYEKKLSEYKQSPSEVGYESLMSEYSALSHVEKELRRIGTGLTFEALAPKPTISDVEKLHYSEAKQMSTVNVPASLVSTQFYIEPKVREEISKKVEWERGKTVFEKEFEEIGKKIENLPVFKELHGFGEFMLAESVKPPVLVGASGSLTQLGFATVGNLALIPESLVKTGVVGYEFSRYATAAPKYREEQKRLVERLGKQTVEAPQKVASYVLEKPSEALVQTSALAISLFVGGKLLGGVGAGVGREASRVWSEFKPVQVYQKTRVSIQNVLEESENVVATGKVRSTAFSEVLGKKVVVESGGAFETVLSEPKTVLRSELPSFTGKLELIKPPVKQFGEWQLKEGFKKTVLPSYVEKAGVTRMPFLRNVVGESTVFGAVKPSVVWRDWFGKVKYVEGKPIKFKAVSAQEKFFETPSGSEYARSVSSLKMRSGESFISRGVSTKLLETESEVFLFGKSNVVQIGTRVKPRAFVLEQTIIEDLTKGTRLEIPSEVKFEKFGELSPKVKPFEAKPLEVKPTEVKPFEVKPTKVKPIEVKSFESKKGSVLMQVEKEKVMPKLKSKIAVESESQRAANVAKIIKIREQEYARLFKNIGVGAGRLAIGLKNVLRSGEKSVISAKTKPQEIVQSARLVSEKPLIDLRLKPVEKPIFQIKTINIPTQVHDMIIAPKLFEKTYEKPIDVVEPPSIPILPPVVVPGFMRFGDGFYLTGGKKRFSKGVKRSVGYAPSLKAVLFGITATRVPKQKYFTELSERPVIVENLNKQRWFYLRKRRRK